MGLEWSGLGETVWQVEADPFCRTVLAKHWPNVDRSVIDVREATHENLAPVDLVCGGFPCQDVSGAGKGEGLAGSRSGLWSEYARVLKELRPPWAVVENVSSGSKRWVDAVCRELGQLGYEALPVPLSAQDVGAPHLRRRIFIIAHTQRHTLRDRQQREPPRQPGRIRDQGQAELVDAGTAGPSADADAHGCNVRARTARHDSGVKQPQNHNGRMAELSGVARRAPAWAPASQFRGMDDGIPHRVDRLKALGNSVVPQCAEVIGWMIRELQEQMKRD
ncbi:MAG: DNA cytosine methyltransferase [Alphaproteobacteria bacterium]